MIELLVLSLGMGLIGYGIFKWATMNNDYFAKRGVKHIKPYFIVGNTGGFFLSRFSMNDFISSLYKKFPNEKVFGLFDLMKPFLIVRDPEVLKQLTVKDFDFFEDHRAFIDERTDLLFGNSLFMMRGEKWRDMRATLSPAFTGSKMRQMFELVNDCAYDMAAYFKKKANNGEELHEEMKELFGKYTNDVIASTAFGIKVNSFENSKNEFFVNGIKMLNFSNIKSILKLMMSRVIPRIMQALNIQFIDANASRFFKTMVLETIDVRTKNNIFRPDMINIMMQLKNGRVEQPQPDDNEPQTKNNDGFATVEESSIGKLSVKRQWNDNEIVAQCFLFFVAGFDTSSTALMFTAYELALHPELQEKLYAEILETNSRLNGKKLPYDELQKMKYMDQIISETLRMWPPAPISDRICVKDYDYDDGTNQFRIEKGMSFWVPIYAFHHDPQYFPSPEKYDPERFSDENKHTIVPGTYIPFGVGPRNCVGSRFALMEVKAVIYYLLLNFKFVPNKKTQIPVKLAKTPTSIKTERGMHLQMVPR